MHRRALLLALLASPAAAQAPERPVYAPVDPAKSLVFPRDHGAHPDFRTEWWYVTGWLDAPGGPLGFQVTFFRTRPDIDQSNPSAFAPRQILFAHAALSDPRLGKLLHDQRAARAGFGLAEASTRDADIVLNDWSFRRDEKGVFHTRAGGGEFRLDLAFAPTQPLIPQGIGGFSQKGPHPSQASHYFSLPHLAVSGTVTRGGRAVAVKGSAWLDREWSSTLLDPAAVGWDWTGLNLDDGSALMAFQVRDKAGKPLWAGGSLRTAKGLTRFAPGDVRFEPVRRWTSPRTGATYPVAVRLTAAGRTYDIAPLFDDQELDSRQGGGPVYWEGAVRTAGGRGYLELTGYVSPLKM